MEEIIYYTLHYGKVILAVVFTLVLAKLIFSDVLKNYHSRWSTMINDFEFSSEEFYSLLEKELRSKGVVGIKPFLINLQIGNMFSSSRKYMRVNWREYQYDICASPFGNGYFISWWLLYKNSMWQILVLKIPIIGEWLSKKLFPVTYYKIDTASMFMSFCQQAVLKVVSDITDEKGIRTLTESEKKPVLGNIFKR